MVRETPQLRAIADEAKVLVRAGVDETKATARLWSMAAGDVELLRRAIVVGHGRDAESAAAGHLLYRASEQGEPSDLDLSSDERALLEQPTEEAFCVAGVRGASSCRAGSRGKT